MPDERASRSPTGENPARNGANQSVTIVLFPRKGDRSRPEDVYKRGSITAIFRVDAGALRNFTADPAVRNYLESGIPVVATFEDPADAATFKREIGDGSLH